MRVFVFKVNKTVQKPFILISWGSRKKGALILEEIPKKGELIKLDHIRIDNKAGDSCDCMGMRKVMLNTKSRQVYCNDCGGLIDPFNALKDIAYKMERENEQVQRLREQAENLQNYKPWLKAVRSIEQGYRGKKMLPCCPRCDKPFFLEEIDSWRNRQLAEKQIQLWKGQEQ